MTVIERSTGKAYKAEQIDGGYQILTLEGEAYKKIKDSTFKRYFKVTEDAPKAEEAKEKATPKTKEKQPVDEDKRQQMIEKVKKLMALAENNPSQEEAISAALMAQKLMAKYNIHEDDITLEEIKEGDITSIRTEQKHNSHLMAWRKSLACIVARNFRCKCYMLSDDVVFRGYKEDAQLAHDTYLMLYNVGNKLGSQMYSSKRAEKGSGKGVYNSYVTGFLNGVYEALNKQCTALLVVIPKAVEEEWEEFSKDFKQSRKTNLSSTDYEVYKKGYEAGKSAVDSHRLEEKEGH